MKKLDTKITVTAAMLMALAIVLGAFGAHGLKDAVDESSLDTFEIGVRYQVYHSLALLMIGFTDRIPQKLKKRSLVLWLVGILLFCGSLYLLAIEELLGMNLSFLGPITPIGGLAFILGWIYLGVGLWKTSE